MSSITTTGNGDDDEDFPCPMDPTVIQTASCACYSGAAPIGQYHGQDVYPKDLKPEARERMKQAEIAERSHHPVLPWVW